MDGNMNEFDWVKDVSTPVHDGGKYMTSSGNVLSVTQVTHGYVSYNIKHVSGDISWVTSEAEQWFNRAINDGAFIEMP